MDSTMASYPGLGFRVLGFRVCFLPKRKLLKQLKNINK
jgi:hypothetical protein